MNRFIPMEIDSIRVSMMNQRRILLLKGDKSGDIRLPIYIGATEAETILYAIQGIVQSRPTTSRLLQRVIKTLGYETDRAEIFDIREDNYIARITLRNPQTSDTKEIQCRPSDAIALAIYANIPVFVREDIVTATGIRPEEDIRSAKSQKPPAANTPNGNMDAMDDIENDIPDLSAFQSFFDSMDLGGND